MSSLTLKVDTGNLAEAIYALAKALEGHTHTITTQQTCAQQLPQQAPTSVPVASAPTSSVPAPSQTISEYTFEQLATAATPLIDAGRQAELIGLLAKFGVQALTQLPKERYGEFAQELRRLGAII